MTERRFTADDQRAFAALSGDWNPIHVDPVFARRTAAAAEVVHGINLLLAAIEQAAQAGYDGMPVGSLRVRFPRFVLVGEDVRFEAGATDGDRLELRWTSRGVVRAEILIRREAAGINGAALPVEGAWFNPGSEPLAPSSETMAGLIGRVPFAAPLDAWTAAFPRAAAWLGAERIAAIGASTRLVGMVCPGLHSVYLELKADFPPSLPAREGGLRFSMGRPRHGLIGGQIEANGLRGSVNCLIRTPPAVQESMAQLRQRLAHSAFAGDRALVIGGSRGLGEVAAKLLAAGGAHVAITYARGEDEAQRVAAEIRADGGSCEILPYTIERDAVEQLATLADAPSHIYYFATPQIARANSALLDGSRLAEMLAFYVEGFWALTAAIQARRADARLFYPSSIYVEQRPRGLAEYAMAKAAGEILCAEINATMAPLRVTVTRLPQLATDQNITTSGVAGGVPADALLPAMLALHARG